MRIGLFTDTYCPEINGVATSTQQLKKGLEMLGNEVFVFAPNIKNIAVDDKNVIRKYSIPFVLLKDRRVCLFNTRKAVNDIRALNLDIVHSQTEFVMGHLARLSAEEYNIPHIHTYHTVYEDYTHYLKIPGKNSDFVKGLVRKASKYLCERADVVVVPTDKVRALLEGYGVRRDIYVQPTGIDYDKFSNPDMQRVAQLKEKYGIKSSNKVLIAAGRMAKEKNVAELVEFLPDIIKLQPDTMLVIVGEGPEKQNLEHMVKSLGLERNVVFTGPVPWSEMQDYYALGDIFVSASTSETQGLTYIEALSSNKPLLVRWDDCLESVLCQNQNGIGYTTRSEFVNGYFNICQNYNTMLPQCRSTAMKYSNITFAQNILDIYKALVE